MRIQFVKEALRTPFHPQTELVVCPVWEDERPVRGLAGLIDWHLLGRLQEWVLRRLITGKRSETVILPGRPHIAIDKVVLLGVGRAESYGEAEFSADLRRTAVVAAGLRARSPLIELPIRRTPQIATRRAASLLYEGVLSSKDQQPVWTVVASDEDAKQMLDQIAIEEMSARKL